MKTLGNTWTAKQFIANLNPVAVDFVEDESGVSVLVMTSKGKKAMGFWIDLWKDDDGIVCKDWNQYIFHLIDEDDCLRRDMQDDPDFFDLMTCTAEAYAEAQRLV